MKLTKIERIILANQLKILEKLYPDEANHYSAQRDAIEGGYILHYDDIIETLCEEMPEKDCLETINILKMYRTLTFSFQNLKDNNEGIDPQDIKFPGFDYNETEELRRAYYIQYFMHILGKFKELWSPDPDYNSHEPMLNRYRNMLQEWTKHGDKSQLTREEIIQILEADKLFTGHIN